MGEGNGSHYPLKLWSFKFNIHDGTIGTCHSNKLLMMSSLCYNDLPPSITVKQGGQKRNTTGY